MRKVFLGFVLSFFVFGGWFLLQKITDDSVSPVVLTEKKVVTPSYRMLSTGDGNLVGQGFFVQDNVLITNNHILDVYEDLFWNDISLGVVGRDSSGNIAFLANEELISLEDIVESPTSPFVGQELYWLELGTVHMGKVRSISTDNTYESFDVVIQLEGDGSVESAGSPVFNTDGEVYGIVIASNPLDDSVVVARIQDVKNIAQGMVGE